MTDATSPRTDAQLPTDELDGVAELSGRERWRLILGQRASEIDGRYGLPQGACDAGSAGSASGGWAEYDEALEFVYGESSSREGGHGDSAPYIAKWLGDVRRYFDRSVVAVLEKDAIERKGLTRLLLEPEFLERAERNVELAAKLIALKDLMPERTKATAREVVAAVVRDVEQRLRFHTEAAVRGKRSRTERVPKSIARNLDLTRTILRNLGEWDAERRVVIPRRLHYWADQRRRKAWDVFVVVDQSGSMASSVVYASIMAAIFASLPALRTRLILFDTEVVDMTELLSDPVDVLFGAQLGGGTDIARAVTYAADLVERPRQTVFVLITDLYEGGSRPQLLSRIAELVDGGVKTFCLLALSDQGHPSYDASLAAELEVRGVPAFACTPDRLADLVGAVMQGGDPVAIGDELRSLARRGR